MQIKIYINGKEELTLLDSNPTEIKNLMKVLYNSISDKPKPHISAYILEHYPHKAETLVDFPLDYIIEKNKKEVK